MRKVLDFILKSLTPVVLLTIIAILVASHYDRVSDLRSDYNEKINALERESRRNK